MINPMDGSCLVYAANPARKLSPETKNGEQKQQQVGNSFVQKTKLANQLWGETFGNISKLPGSITKQNIGYITFPPPSTKQTCEKCIELKSVNIECDSSKGRIELPHGGKFNIELQFHRQFVSEVDCLKLNFEKEGDDTIKIPVDNMITETSNQNIDEASKLEADYMRLIVDLRREEFENKIGAYRLHITTSHQSNVGSEFDYFVENIVIN